MVWAPVGEWMERYASAGHHVEGDEDGCRDDVAASDLVPCIAEESAPQALEAAQATGNSGEAKRQRGAHRDPGFHGMNLGCFVGFPSARRGE